MHNSNSLFFMNLQHNTIYQRSNVTRKLDRPRSIFGVTVHIWTAGKYSSQADGNKCP
eukprot:m.212641 g.212641  ORF g.212641 m.212641 type:complete len:57 (+) comp39776_c1_seq4:4563-4733(+)